MYCSKCGGQLAPNTAFCNACGAPASVAVTGAAVVKRPGIITLLAVLQLIGAAIWLLAALGAMAATFLGSSRGQGAETVLGVLLVGALGAAQLFCGIGLLKLKPHGRTLQLVFAWIGLIGIPIGTIISILILVYLYKPGIKALFSGKELSEFTAEELAQVRSCQPRLGGLDRTCRGCCRPRGCGHDRYRRRYCNSRSPEGSNVWQ